MRVVAYDPYASAEKAAAQGVTLVTFDEALAQGDFFSLHMPLTPGTKNMFNDAAFAKMKKGARIMNVARGGVIEDEALARALDAGIVAAAALDVFEEEPPKFEGHPLIGRWGHWGRVRDTCEGCANRQGRWGHWGRGVCNQTRLGVLGQGCWETRLSGTRG
jgi:lactate dehydrogenase-like 2-hydroxyacid dehydrogenase